MADVGGEPVVDIRGSLVRVAVRILRGRPGRHLVERSRVLDAIVAGLSLPARARMASRRAGGQAARILGLATVEDLRELEESLVRQRADRTPGGGAHR